MKLDVVRSQLLRECTESRETLGQYKQRDNIILKVVISFVCLAPVHSLPSSKAVFYHVNDQLQRLKEVIATFII